MGTSEIHEALRLHALGGLSISSNGATLSGTVARRRSLALLALAASSGETGVSDEQALALLWPDFDLARARNNLKQVAFALRQALDRDAFIRTTTTLRLDPALFSVDRWDFEKAIARRDTEAAVALYTGPFLAGFHISGLSEFEKWVETERDRLAHTYTGALTTVALGAEAAGDFDSAIEWWRKAVAEDRLNDTNAQRLIRTLAVSGDTAGALQQARVHQTLLTQELDAKPSQAFLQLVEEIRTGVPVTSNASRSSVRANTPIAVPAIVLASTPREMPATVPAPSNGVQSAQPERREPVRDRRGPSRIARLRRAWTTGEFRRQWSTGERRVAGFTTRLTSAAILLIVIGAIAAIIVNQFGPGLLAKTAENSSDTIILPFAVNGSREPGNSGAVVSELLAAGLDGSLGLRALAVAGDSVPVQSPEIRRASAKRLAVRLGAGFFISGDVFESGDRVRITAEFRSAQNDTLLDRAVVEGPRTKLFDLVDGVASQLLAGRIAGGRRDVVRVASVTTASLPAAKAYFRGEAALADGGFRAAIDAYEEAIQLDPTFALAHYGLANAADMLGNDDVVREAANRALQHAQQLPSRQRRLLTAFVARQQGDVAGAKRLYAQLTSDYPADAEAWLGLGETLFHLNPLDGEPATDARNAFERAAALDSLNIGAFVHLARIAALGNDEPRSRRMVQHARALAPESVVARFALHVLSLGVPPDLASRPAVQDRGRVSGVPLADAVDLLTNSGADNLRRYAKQLSTSDVRGYGLRLLSLVEAGQGRIMDAMALLDTCSATNHSLAIEARSRLAVLPFTPLRPGEIDQIRSDLSSWAGVAYPTELEFDSAAHSAAHQYRRLHRLGLIAVRMSDTATAERITSQLDAMANAAQANIPGRMLATSLRAHITAARGQTREALRLLEQVTGARVASATSLEAFDRLLRAQLLEQEGRYDDALGFYAQLGDRSPFEVTLIWQADLGTARIHEKRGNMPLAVRYYRRVAERLALADSALHPARDAAEQKAVALLPLDSGRRF